MKTSTATPFPTRGRVTPYYRPDRAARLLRITNRIEEDAVVSALVSGELVTAHQAAKAVGVAVSTFNYHLKKGRIPHLSTPGGVNYVTREDAEAFALRLARWRATRDYASTPTPATTPEGTTLTDGQTAGQTAASTGSSEAD